MQGSFLEKILNQIVFIMISLLTVGLLDIALPALPQYLKLFMAMSAGFLVMSTIDAIAKKFLVKSILKEFNVNSVDELKAMSDQYTKYMADLKKLGPTEQQEILEKMNRTSGLIKDYEARPDWYFENTLQTTKEKQIQQVKDSFQSWMEQKGYPTYNPKKK